MIDPEFPFDGSEELPLSSFEQVSSRRDLSYLLDESLEALLSAYGQQMDMDAADVPASIRGRYTPVSLLGAVTVDLVRAVAGEFTPEQATDLLTMLLSTFATGDQVAMDTILLTSLEMVARLRVPPSHLDRVFAEAHRRAAWCAALIPTVADLDDVKRMLADVLELLRPDGGIPALYGSQLGLYLACLSAAAAWLRLLGSFDSLSDTVTSVVQPTD